MVDTDTLYVIGGSKQGYILMNSFVQRLKFKPHEQSKWEAIDIKSSYSHWALKSWEYIKNTNCIKMISTTDIELSLDLNTMRV